MKDKKERQKGIPVNCQDLQKPLKEGRRDCCGEAREESDVNACEGGMKKCEWKKDHADQRRCQKEVW